jgi:RHH-type rel operon transcriptional repressor/antitoxin RelB
VGGAYGATFAMVQRREMIQEPFMVYLYSEVRMLAIRLPQSIEKRLDKLARRTGRTKTYYAREAILQHLEDLEDRYLAEHILERIRSGEENTIPLEDVIKRHGLEG